jgi:hypothetical protein
MRSTLYWIQPLNIVFHRKESKKKKPEQKGGDFIGEQDFFPNLNALLAKTANLPYFVARPEK